jgi:hypothetical protein
MLIFIITLFSANVNKNLFLSAFYYDILLLFSPYSYSTYNIFQFNLRLARLVAVTYNKENNETISTIERKGT